MGDKYHHGDLRGELVRGALDLIAEQGLEGFSVAQVAKRVKVSPGAPYRHFATREKLLAEVATRMASQLADRVTEAAERAKDPTEALSAAAGEYTRYLIERRAGMNVIYADGLQGPENAELHKQTRRLTDQFLLRCLAVAPTPQTALELMEQLFTQAHGYGTFQLDGVFAKQGYTVDQVVEKSKSAAHIAIKGRTTTTPDH